MARAGRIVDLSQEIYHQAPTFPWDPKCGVIVHNTVESIGFNVTQLCMSAHQGTHVDAPYHFLDDGLTVDRIPAEVFVGDAILIDARYKKPKELLTQQDLQGREAAITRGSRVVIMTGWDEVFPDRRYLIDFPSLSKDLADWLASKRIALLGVDFPSLSLPDGPYVHRSLLGAGVVIIEGLCHLKEIRAEKFYLIAAPLKIRGRDGSPVRALGIVDG
ncbi:MAG: cyclase family protein [Spirochaetia bacterium]|jgi:kynurenine formamidase